MKWKYDLLPEWHIIFTGINGIYFLIFVKMRHNWLSMFFEEDMPAQYSPQSRSDRNKKKSAVAVEPKEKKLQLSPEKTPPPDENK
jgi:hypothetical protein